MMIGEGEDPVAAAVHFNLRIGPPHAWSAMPDQRWRPPRQGGCWRGAGALSQGRSVGLPGAVWLVTARGLIACATGNA